MSEWLERRTGVVTLSRRVLEGPIPGGASWKYSLGFALTTAFAIQLVTGVLMMFTYSPSAETAWGSVFYIQHAMTLGWVIRGLHHFGSQATVVILGLHLLQVLLAGAYRSPREVNWWIGLALMVLVLGLAATGYQLPWDQKGYWSTKIAANFAGGVPLVGPVLRKIAVGGTEFGNQTVTRFFALHVAVMPGLVLALLTVHVLLFHKNGVTASRAAHKLDRLGLYWPEQAFRDAVCCVLVVGVIAAVVVVNHGASLDAPADPSSPDFPARPEWYFLPLYQFLKKLPGKYEFVGTVILPAAILGFMALIPLLDRVLPRRAAHGLACTVVLGLFFGAGYMLYDSLEADAHDKLYLASRARADEASRRALELAANPAVMVPPEGSSYVLLRDPLYHGRAVLEKKCLGCHYFGGKGAAGEAQVAADLKDFGSYAWIRGLLDKPGSATYFGKVPGCDGMAEWKRSSKLSSKQLDDVADFVASFAKITPELTHEEWLALPGVSDHPGVKPFVKECGQCHVIDGLTEGGLRDGPGLFAWGSPRWIRRMVRKPHADDLYGFLDKKEQMPAFPADQLTDDDLTTVVRYLRNDYPDAPTPPARAKAAVAGRVR